MNFDETVMAKLNYGSADVYCTYADMGFLCAGVVALFPNYRALCRIIESVCLLHGRFFFSATIGDPRLGNASFGDYGAV